MTTEKIISVLEITRLSFEMSLPSDDCDCDKDTLEAREDNEETIEAINEAIKALKRGDVLDKIKRDIFNACSDNYHMPVYKLDCDKIFEIIDKHKAESEG